jgi:hypothetical protein
MTKARDIASAAPAPAGVTSTELGYVDGVTSAIQTQMDTKAPSTSPTLVTPVLRSPEERCTVSAIAATGTINFDALTQGVLHYTSAATGNWTLNVRGDSGTTLNSALATGDAITVVFMNTNTTTPFYATGFQIDGSSVTPRWQNGVTPSAGNANSIDIYTYTIIKTGSATYVVLASQTRFA